MQIFAGFQPYLQGKSCQRQFLIAYLGENFNFPKDLVRRWTREIQFHICHDFKKTTNWATKGRVISRAMRSLLQQISIDRFG